MKIIQLNKLWLSVIVLLSMSSVPAFALRTPLTAPADQVSQSPQTVSTASQFKQQMMAVVIKSQELLAQGNAQKALSMLDNATQQFEQRYQLPLGAPPRVYTPNDIGKTNSYSRKVTAMEEDAPGLSTYWDDILYLKAYTLVEAGDLNAAIKVLKTAIAYAPDKADNYSELGHIYQVNKDWERAKTNFSHAFEVSQYSEPALRITHKTRALRGMGFVAIEQGQLDIAKGYYQQSLKLDPNDKMAKMELGYIEQLANQ